ncbi:MAG: sulfur carrier protein ThiS [Holophaga sp.]|nr:sulfur carrier protein ThiS [Holophaga sp.]
MIQVNGDGMEWQDGLTVRGVLVHRNFRFPLLIITVNGELVQPKAYDSTLVPDGAEVQVVHLMSGG